MKTISVYDAVKLATKGPLRLVRDAQGPCMVMHPTEEGVAVCCLTETHRPLGGYAGQSFPKPEKGQYYPATWPQERNANATLLAHFFNHGPALLAMLEEFVKLYEPFRKQLDANETEILDESIALIAKASKVEIEE